MITSQKRQNNLPIEDHDHGLYLLQCRRFAIERSQVGN